MHNVNIKLNTRIEGLMKRRSLFGALTKSSQARPAGQMRLVAEPYIQTWLTLNGNWPRI